MEKNNHSTIHANMMVIDGIGALIRGKPKLGKSELCLALIDRGHQLVCDDATEIHALDNTLMASCPESINCFMQIDYLGVTNIAKIFGEKALTAKHKIDICIDLKSQDTIAALSEPLQPLVGQQSLLGIDIPTFQMPITAGGRALPLLVEILVRNYKLRLDGYDAFSDLHQHLTTIKQRSAACKKND